MAVEEMDAFTVFTVRVRTGNAAFTESDGTGLELAHILRGLADQVQGGTTIGILRDTNGNTVGEFGWED